MVNMVHCVRQYGPTFYSLLIVQALIECGKTELLGVPRYSINMMRVGGSLRLAPIITVSDKISIYGLTD